MLESSSLLCSGKSVLVATSLVECRTKVNSSISTKNIDFVILWPELIKASVNTLRTARNMPGFRKSSYILLWKNRLHTLKQLQSLSSCIDFFSPICLWRLKSISTTLPRIWKLTYKGDVIDEVGTLSKRRTTDSLWCNGCTTTMYSVTATFVLSCTNNRIIHMW